MQIETKTTYTLLELTEWHLQTIREALVLAGPSLIQDFLFSNIYKELLGAINDAFGLSSESGLPSEQDMPASADEYQIFVRVRAKKLLEKLCQAGLDNAGDWMKRYLLNRSGKSGLKQISATTFENLLAKLEVVTPKEAVQIVKAGEKSATAMKL